MRGILSQADVTRLLKPIAYFSSGLTSSQKNYSAGKLECWALIAASRKFRKYLQSAPSARFISDHNPLVWLRRQKDPRGKFARWIQELEGLDYEIEHVKGRDNAPADFWRTRSEVDWRVNNEAEHFERHVYQTQHNPDIRSRIETNQGEDVITSSAINQLEDSNEITHGQFKDQLGMVMREGLLCRGRKVVVPGRTSFLYYIAKAIQVLTRQHVSSRVNSTGSG